MSVDCSLLSRLSCSAAQEEEEKEVEEEEGAAAAAQCCVEVGQTFPP